MYQEQTKERQQIGIERLSGGHRGLLRINEKEVVVVDPETNIGHTEYTYDVYEIENCGTARQVKNAVVTEEHPFGDEHKILRKTLAFVLNQMELMQDPRVAEFKSYHEFVESL